MVGAELWGKATAATNQCFYLRAEAMYCPQRKIRLALEGLLVEKKREIF